MDKRLWMSLLGMNLMLVMFFGFWKMQEKNKNRDHVKIREKLEHLEKNGAFSFELPDMEGENISILDVKADIIMLHFWATWCAPCVVEYPALLRMIESFKGRIKLVSISSDEDKEDLLRFYKKFGKGTSDVIHLWDPEQKISKKYGTEKLPESYILNSDYKLIRKVPNTENWDSEQVRNFFRYILNPTN